MRRPCVVLTLLLVVGLLGCVHRPPTTPIGPRGPLADAPSKEEIDIIFHGLVAFVFKKDGSVQSVFLNPTGHPHIPLLAVDTTHIDKLNSSKPDFVATGTGDTGLAVWEFSEAKVDPTDFDDKALDFDARDLDLVHPDYDKLRWVPSMTDIFGTPQPVDPDAIKNAAARGTWTVGKLSPVFDRDKHKTDPWTIGMRMKTPVADGLRLRLSLADPGSPLAITLTRRGDEELVLVNGGATVYFSDYPKRIPKPNEDMEHFHHFYALCKDHTTEHEPTHAVPPTPYPARCAPSIFYPPVNE